jgi:acetyl-CoA carboxylase carboxyl transferase subunit alpha
MDEKNYNIDELCLKLKELEEFSNLYGIDIKEETEVICKKINEIKEKSKEITAWDRVTTARKAERPVLSDYIEKIFDGFIEFHGDRYFGDDTAVIGGIAYFEDVPVTIVGHQKGKNTKENISRNFGMAKPEGYRKALRLMKQAEKFKRPIFCFIDTPGAFCGVEAEERGQGEAIARNMMEMSALKVPIISTVIGEGGSGGALAFGVADRVYMMENSIYSVISPEGCASILLKDANCAKEASEYLKLTASDLKRLGIIDDIIEEPDGGAHNDIDKSAMNVKAMLSKGLNELKPLDVQELLTKRYQKFRAMGYAK